MFNFRPTIVKKAIKFVKLLSLFVFIFSELFFFSFLFFTLLLTLLTIQVSSPTPLTSQYSTYRTQLIFLKIWEVVLNINNNNKKKKNSNGILN